MNSVCFVVNNLAFFNSHRLPLALALVERGCNVTILHGKAGHDEMERNAAQCLNELGIPTFLIPISGSSLNPAGELLSYVQLVCTIRRLSPDVVHFISPKFILLGAALSVLMGSRLLVFAVTGLGSGHGKASGLKALFISLLQRLAFGVLLRAGTSSFIFQNQEDMAHFQGIFRRQPRSISQIDGSGIDLSLYRDISFKAKENIVLLPARMITDKGIQYFCEAASLVAEDHPEWKFLLAGPASYDNPGAYSASELKRLEEEFGVGWLGHVEDIHTLFRRAKVVCLPSRREGFPKVLMEAAAAGCAVVTSDVVGCRDAVIRGETALLVEWNNAEEIAAACRSLIEQPSVMKSFGERGIRHAWETFGVDRVVEQHFSIYTQEHSVVNK